MQEFSVPAAYIVKPDDNITDDVFLNAENWPDTVGLRRRENGRWTPVTWHDFAVEVRQIAAGLISAGIQPGDRVALMSRTRFEWTLLDYAILAAGGVVVPIYPTSSLEQVEWILGDSGATAAVVETDVHAEMIAAVRDKLPALAHAWQIDGTRLGGLADLKAGGADVTPGHVEERRRTRGAADLAEIVYTSGTTGRPKGCMLSHGNLLYEARVAIDSLQRIFGGDASTLLFLPLAHVFARVIQVACVERGVRLAHSADLARLPEDLAALQPSFLLAVPRVFERVYNSAQQRAQADGKGKIFDWADRTAVAYSQALDDGRPGWRLRLAHRLVYRRLRAALGGRVGYAISGGAPLGVRLGHFLRGIGITVLEGYGLTESTAAATVNLPHAVKIGTVGPPLPGVKIQIADDGEILIKGPIRFQGYWRNDQATRETLTTDGWLRTGDIGTLDEDGFLTISGRKKELIVTAGGKNLAPEPLEDRLRAHPLISQVVVVGDQRPYAAALIALDAEALAPWKRAAGVPEQAGPVELRDNPGLRVRLQTAVDEANKAVGRAESIRRFRVLPVDLTEENGYLTPTLKVKRALVQRDFTAEIEELYH